MTREALIWFAAIIAAAFTFVIGLLDLRGCAVWRAAGWFLLAFAAALSMAQWLLPALRG